MAKFAAPVLTSGALFFLAGCGRYDPEAEYPRAYADVPPPPPAAAQLAASGDRPSAPGADGTGGDDGREIPIGVDSDEYSDTDPSALTEFKPALDDHGAWVDDATYGTVWVPSSTEVGTDFQPYVTAGHWTYSEPTDYVWVSDYSWGWAPFHYGRWVHLPGHGWAWIPGRRYAGAWVTWRVGPAGYGYVGWAPAPPDWYWIQGAAVGWSFGWYRPYDYYVYCPHNYVYHGAVSTYVVRGPAAREHDGRTQDYVPASPGISRGGRVIANPSVNGQGGRDGRVVATPTVGSPRTSASPGVGRGPRPEEMGARDAVIAPPRSNAGLLRAEAFATPRTAIAVGAAAPAAMRPSPQAVEARGAGFANRPAVVVSRDMRSSLTTANASRAPSAPPPSTYRAERSAFSPGQRPSPGPNDGSMRSSATSVASTPSTSIGAPSSAPRFRPPAASVARSAPTFSASPHVGGAASSFRSSAASVSAPRPSAPPSFHASPSVRSSAAPSVRSSSPSRSSGSTRKR